ncbi:MAG: 3-hydroxyacyl-ACP dehydratase FabZ [Deltaproteobacteria bacterium]|jgi:3-hydroxyacyl-[acyl-carrier-protein] dehydratase|nr:3-hydroxyacyl-ACP dehydratase FabZ [Deltaproteobacteria bacterium]
MTVYTVTQIQEYLPHRHPFLLVDRILELDPWRSISSYKNVTFNEPFFAGHFPGHPVMPGVLILEAMAQNAALLLSVSFREHADSRPGDLKDVNLEGKIPYFASCDKVKFRRPVIPGDRLDLRSAILRLGTRAWKVRAEASVEGRAASEAEITGTF